MRVNGRRVNSATVAAYAPVAGFPDAQRATESSAPPPPPPTPIHTLGATYWLDFTGLTDNTIQAFTPRIGADSAQRGSDAGVDTADPTITLGTPSRLTFAGDDRVEGPASATPTFTTAAGLWSLVMVAATTATVTKVLFQTAISVDPGVSLFVRLGTNELVARVGSASNDSTLAVELNDGTPRGLGITVNTGTFRAYERTAGLGTVRVGTVSPVHTLPRIGGPTLPWNGSMWHVVLFDGVALTEPQFETAIDYLLAGL